MSQATARLVNRPNAQANGTIVWPNPATTITSHWRQRRRYWPINVGYLREVGHSRGTLQRVTEQPASSKLRRRNLFRA
jgi:hypothetical protein